MIEKELEFETWGKSKLRKIRFGIVGSPDSSGL